MHEFCSFIHAMHIILDQCHNYCTCFYNIVLFVCFTVTSFSTEAFSTGAAIALTFVLTFLLTLVLGVSISVLVVLAVNKYRRSKKVTLQTEIEMRPPPVIYEEPSAIKPDPLTQGNAAYGEIVY